MRLPRTHPRLVRKLWLPLAQIVFVCLLQCCFCSAVVKPGKVNMLRVADKDALQDALFGGNAWVVHCKEESQDVSEFLRSTAKLFAKSPRCDGHCFVGTLDCKSKLPSGKTVMKRFGVKAKKNIPTIILASNGRKPSQLDAKKFTKLVKGKKGVYELSAKVLAKYVAKISVPKMRYVDKPQDFDDFCLKRRYCVVLTVGKGGKPKSSRLKEMDKKSLKKYVRKYRQISFLQLNSSKWELNVLGENIEGIPRLPSDSAKKIRQTGVEGVVNMVAFRKVKNHTNAGYGKFRQLNALTKPGESAVAMSLCRQLIHLNTSASEARKIFKAHKVSIGRFEDKPVSLLKHPDALFRINKHYFTWTAAASYMASLALYKAPISMAIMQKISAHVSRKEEKKSKAKGGDKMVISSKLLCPNASSECSSKSAIKRSELDKFFKSVLEDEKSFKMNDVRPVVRRYYTVAEKNAQEEREKRKTMNKIKTRRKRKEQADKRMEKKKKKLRRRRRRAKERTGKGKEELKKERAQRELRRREEMEREMQEMVTAVDPDEGTENSEYEINGNADEDHGEQIDDDSPINPEVTHFDEEDEEEMYEDDDDDDEIIDLDDMEDSVDRDQL